MIHLLDPGGMLIKKQKPPARLPLSDIVRDPSLAVRPVIDAVAEDYAEHLETLPAITVWEILGKYYLADGWHRYRAHELAGATDIKVIIMSGSIEQAKLYIANCDIRVGVRRTREAKRAAVLMVLSTERGAAWGDRELARHCGVSHTFVSLVKARLAGNVAKNEETQGATVEQDRDRASDGPSGNVATAPIDKSGNVANEAVERADARVASWAVATAKTCDGNAPAEAYLDGGDEFDLDTEGDASTVSSKGRGPTVGDVIDQIGALIAVCENDDERRGVLDQVGDAVIGMLDELGPPEDVPEDEDDDLGIAS